MKRESVLHKVLSGLLSLALMLQVAAPAMAAPAAQTPVTPERPRTAAESDAAAAMAAAAAPDVLAHPFSITRAQSHYQAGEDLVVTYTVRNNQSAAQLPDVGAGLNLTDTVAALSGYDPLDDPNTLRGVIVSAELDNGAAFLDASLWPDADGDRLLFQLGDIAPRASVAFSVTLAAPATASSFVELDGGAEAFGTLHGRMATAVAPPIRLAPDGFADWLISTPDAVRDDEAMLFRLAALGDDPLALFQFVQDLDYEAYEGSLRGARGTLWSQAGNSADQASLLIAMLRAAGYPARYRHGDLPQAEAQTLIGSMFDAPGAVRGHAPAAAEISDPGNDPALLALAQDHWWVEAYLPGGGWTNLDPTIAAAAAGDVFAAPAQDGADRIAELPDAVRHKLSFTLDVEQYSAFPLGGLNLQESTVLTAVIPAAQTAGLPVNIAFAVESNVQGGAVFVSAEHTYTPYLAYGDSAETIFGTPIQDLLTNFPLSTRFTTGVWLQVTSTAPDGRSDAYRRTIKDLIGPDLRLGGDAQLPPRDDSPLLSNSDLIQVQPIPHSAYPAAAADRAFHALIQQAPALVDAFNGYQSLSEETADVDDITAFAEEQLPALYDAQFAQLDLISAMFQYASTWEGKPIGAETMLVKSYPDRPKLILSSQTATPEGSLQTSFELLNIAEKAIPYPGQNVDVVQGANFLRTTAEKSMEYELLDLFLPGEVRSAVRTMLAAEEQGIPIRFIVAENLGELDELAIPDETKAHITNYAQNGALISVPEQMVSMPYGEDIGFMVVAPDGDARYVNADGYTAAAAIFYGLQNARVIVIALIQGGGLAFVGGYMAYIFTFFAEAFPAIINAPPLTIGQLPGAAAGLASGKGLLLGLIAATHAALPLPLGSCGLSPNPPSCQLGVLSAYATVVAAIIAGIVGGGLDPSLTDFWMSDLPLLPSPTVSMTTVTAAPTLAGSVNLDVTAVHQWSASADLSSDWSSSHTQAAQFDALTADSADLSQDGAALGSGSLAAEAGQAQFSGVAQQWSLSAAGATAAYAPAADGLAVTQVGAYTAVAAAPQARLFSNNAALDGGLPYSGDLEATFNSPVTLAGAGAAPAPHFAAAHSLTLQQGRVMVSGIDGGTVTVGGTAVPNIQSLAVADYSGAVSLTDGGDRDQVALNGTADFFALTATPASAAAAVNQSVSINAELHTNYNDAYTLTVSVPDGWAAGTAPGGTAVVTPTAQAAPGAATILLVAQSTQYPDLFASAAVELNLAAHQGVDVAVTPDPLLTVPMGEPQGTAYDVPLTLNHVADGRAEVPGAAFNVAIRNDSTTAATFDVSVSGLPAGWAVWSNGDGAQTAVALPAGAQQTLGLYVVPPPGPLPAAGTDFPFTVTVTDQANGGVTDGDGGAFTMPALPFPYLTVEPLAQTVLPGDPVTVSLALQNVGNGAASFPVTVTVRDGHFSTAEVSPAVLVSPETLDTGALAPAALFTHEIVLDTADAAPGSTYFVEPRSVAGEYEPMAMAAVQFASPLAMPMLEKAACQAEPARAATTNLVDAFMAVETACAEGDCLAQPRLDLLNAVDSYLASVAVAGFAGDAGAVTAARDAIANATAGAELLDALADLSPAVAAVSSDLCEISEHRVDGRFTPYVDAILLGEAADFSLDVSNEGTLTTTYAITVAGLPGGDLYFDETIHPGATVNLPLTPTPAQLGVFDLTADIVAVAPDVQLDVGDTAVARLNVVDKFVQVTQVLADPPFVETGVSSTDLSVAIANPSGVLQEGTARTAVLAPDGGAAFSADIPLSVPAGTPRLHELAAVDTSGWAEGTYTVTVDFLDENEDLIPEGSGYGYFSVGQGLVASQAVVPELVAPGEVTVTTIITTELTQDYIPPEPLALNAEFGTWNAEYGPPAPPPGFVADEVDVDSLLSGPDPAPWVGETAVAEPTAPLTYPLSPPVVTATEPITEQLTENEPQPTENDLQSPGSRLNLSIGGVFTRTEQDDPSIVYSGAWDSFNTNRASGGSFTRADAAGETAEFSFNGAWVNVGFLANRFGGYAEIFIDGVSQGVVDLYRREEAPVSYVYDGLLDATHTISITALGAANPYASREYVQLDYIDAWDGSDLPAGAFEQDATRVITTTGWQTINDGTAGGGSYYRDNDASVWFPFSGDSFTFHAVGRSGGGWAQLSVDGQYLTSVYLYSPDVITRSFSFAGFGAGPHILQVSGYRGNTTVDAFTTPGIPPFDDPNPVNSYTRYEEDHPAWRYNSVPFTQTVQTWDRSTGGLATRASGGQLIGSGAVGDTAVITVSGQWIQLGFGGDDDSGMAEIFLDGVSQGTIDLYRNEDQPLSRTFPDLAPGTHTISLTVHSGEVWIDYVDVWDGTMLPDGTFETFPSDRFYWSGDWRRINDSNAIGGQYLRSNSGTLWFPFTGDSVSYRAFAYSGADEARVYLDDQFMGTLDLFHSADISRTFSFAGLGSGAHVLRVEHHRDNITLEQFITPAAGPAYVPPSPSGVIRYEEDDPALLYNGVPYTQTVHTWSDNGAAENRASEGYFAYSSTPGDHVSLTFDGSWFGVGFLAWRNRGIADIYLDGTLLDSVDLYHRPEDTKSVYYDVAPGVHTISVTVSGASHPYATGSEIAIDYIDVWDGAAEPDGTFEETDRERLIYSPGWTYNSEPAAAGGGYARSGRSERTVWFPFSGDSVAYRAWASRASHEVKIRIDGQPMGVDGVFDIFADNAVSRTISFDGLGPGPHVMEISGYRYDPAVDSFIAPGVAPFYEDPAPPGGIVRYEEDDPALRYNGDPFPQSEYCFLYCWSIGSYRSTSNAYAAETDRAGDWVELDFYGSWAGVGFGTSPGVAEVFIDGTSMITVDLSVGQDVTSVYFDDLITGTHTISAALVSGRMEFDFFDVWDGENMGEGWFEADLDAHRGPFYYSALSSWVTDVPAAASFTQRLQFARDEDAVSRGRISYNTHMWFGFTGDDLLFLPFQKGGKTVEVFIDGVSQGVIDLTPQYSTQPMAYYFTDLGDGPHMVHLNAVDDPWIDAFQVNPPDTLPYTPVVEWHSAAPADVYTDTYANGGLLSTAVIGDLDNDGSVEIVSPSSNGQIYVYRGDGGDTGDGDPILWQSDLIGAAAEPSLADLDGDGDAEIVLVGTDGAAAFHHDGSVYWVTDAIKSRVENAGWGGSSIANLDLEPGPEIVLATHNGALYVLDHDGALLFSEPTGRFPAVPTLADVTGDGFQDVIFAQDRTITVYDAFNNFNVAWTHTHTHTGPYGQAFGAPAVVDVDGKQPGGDDGPEVVVNWGHYVDVFDADGTPLWNFYAGADSFRRPSPVTVADVDGDNEIELLTASAYQSGFLIFYHRLFVLNADGSLLWSQDMGDTSASASGVATQDLNGDGVWEVIWNGLNEGFTIMDGPTGEKTFNEEFTESGTFVDYPAVGDVDGDGFAEVVTGGRNGLYVIGHDEIWGDSRPLWNQHNYHITNINDDWSVPVNEFNSWEVHNTYRTQTPDRNPAPSYQIAFTYTEGIEGVTVLPGTASISLTATPPTYAWAYRQEWYQPLRTASFDSLLSDLQPGEARQVSAGTEVVYTLPGGVNRITLPPLYVTGATLGELAPAAQSVVVGGTAVFTLTLSNPGDSTAVYTLSPGGVPQAWLDYPASVAIDGGDTETVFITVTVPPGADPDTLPLWLDIDNGSGGVESLAAELTVFDGVRLALDPAAQAGTTGQPLTYTLTISNREATPRSYELAAVGPAEATLPQMVTVDGNGAEMVTVTAVPPNHGPQPFTITATAGAADATSSVDGVATGNGRFGVLPVFTPETAPAGPGATTVYSLTLSNVGDTADSYALTLDAPPGWTTELVQYGTPLAEISLPAQFFNSAELLLLVTPDENAQPGSYPITLTAHSLSHPGVAGSAAVTAEVGPGGVDVTITPQTQTGDPTTATTWDVTVTNLGAEADSFDLAAAGPPAAAGEWSTTAVSLAPGASETVQFTVDDMRFLLPGRYELAVSATSQAEPAIRALDRGILKLSGYEEVTVAWRPPARTVTDTLRVSYYLALTNTGNLLTAYDVRVTVAGGDAQVDPARVYAPARGTAVLPVTVQVPGPGEYEATATAVSGNGLTQTATAALTVNVTAEEGLITYMPFIIRQP